MGFLHKVIVMVEFMYPFSWAKDDQRIAETFLGVSVGLVSGRG